MNFASAAIQQALLLQRSPELLFALQQAPIPEGMADLMRLASDAGSVRNDVAQAIGMDADMLQQAADGYLRSICLFPGSQGLRVLALNDASDMRLAKDHHRLLVKWLHPDRNPNHQELAERVNQAWSALKKSAQATPEPVTYSENRNELVAPPSGRFPLFLWGLVVLVVLFWGFSMLPDSDIYVADSGIESTKSDGNVPESAGSGQDSSTEQRLKGLKIAFDDIKKAVLPASQPKPTAVKADPEAVSAPTNKPEHSSPDKKKADKSGITPAPVLAGKNVPSATSIPPTSAVRPASLETPVPAHASVPAIVKIEPVIEQPAAEARRDIQVAAKALLAEFKERYRRGDIDSFMQIFAANARNNRGDRQAIAADYGRLFNGSSSRKISFSGEQWLIREGVVQYRAAYSASVRRQGELLPVSSKGRIELILSDENGKLRIQQILLGE